MEILNNTSFQLALFPGQLNFPGHSLTFLVKGTFNLHNGGPATIADEQETSQGDVFYPDDEDMTGSLMYEADNAYFKPRADLLLSGHCHAPGGTPVPGCRVTFSVGTCSKSLYVFGDRYWKGPPGMRVISDPEPFTQMRISYGNSYGGSGYERNPVGKGFRKEGSESGEDIWPLPNIEDPEHLIDSPASAPEPVGFGPLGRMWQYRASKTGTYSGGWKRKRWPWLPIDFDWGYFNAAPPDMQVEGYLNGDEKIFCENLHPEHSHYESKLPGLRARCFVVKQKESDPGQSAFSEVKLKLDTLWVNMDTEKLVLAWRGSIKILTDDYEDVESVFILSEPLERESATLKQYYRQFLAARKADAEELPFEPEKPEPEKADSTVSGAAAAGMAVPGAALADEVKAELKMPEESAEVPEGEIPTAEPAEIDPEAVKKQTKAFMAQSGIDIDTFPSEIRDTINREMDKSAEKMKDADPAQAIAEHRANLDKQLNSVLSNMGIDPEKPSPLSEKARTQQETLMKELGIDKRSMAQYPELEKLWTLLTAMLPMVGMNPENLAPIIEHAKKQKERIEKGTA